MLVAGVRTKGGVAKMNDPNLFDSPAPPTHGPIAPIEQDIHVNPPACDCRQADDCEHEVETRLTILCELCGEIYTAGDAHACEPDDVENTQAAAVLELYAAAKDVSEFEFLASSFGGAMARLKNAVERFEKYRGE